MEDNFDYREILGELDDIDELIEELMEEQQNDSWELVFRNTLFAVFMNIEGQLRIVNSMYIDCLFTNS